MNPKITQVSNLNEFSKAIRNNSFGMMYSIDDDAGRLVDFFSKSETPHTVVILKQPDGEDFARRLMVEKLPVLLSMNNESGMIEIEAVGFDNIKERYTHD